MRVSTTITMDLDYMHRIEKLVKKGDYRTVSDFINITVGKELEKKGGQ